jgi:hypothetical protein
MCVLVGLMDLMHLLETAIALNLETNGDGDWQRRLQSCRERFRRLQPHKARLHTNGTIDN